MKWTEIKVWTSSEAVEAVANILMEFGASGVSIEDAEDLKHLPVDNFCVIWDVERLDYIQEGASVSAYFPENMDTQKILPNVKKQVTDLQKFDLAIGRNEIFMRELAEESWASQWKKYYHPIQITRYLTIVPNWEDYTPKQADEQVILLDPGMAFGTGDHPTTRLSLQALEMTLHGGETVIDVGTGSGVLSIASKILGAKEVYAYDLDEVAVRSAKENFDLNPVAKNVHIAANDLLVGIDLEVEVVVANILAEIIIPLVPQAWHVLKKSGYFITSGIISAKVSEVAEAITSQGFEVLQTHKMKDWYMILAQKPAE